MSEQETHRHIPVMLEEVLQTLAPADGEIYVDGTFGAGGYTRAILEAADCKVYAIDRDPEALLRAETLAKEFPGRLIPLHGCFGDVRSLLQSAGVEKIDGFVLDLGVSSIQLSTALRGFSFLHDGPLDMRMGLDGLSARDIVNGAAEEDLANIIYEYGEEHASRRIARQIVAAREEAPIETTRQLVNIIHQVIPRHGGMKIDPATRTFQALRIYVNDEMGEIDRALDASIDILNEGGRLVVVSFHSLEDARVKAFLKEKSGRLPNMSRHMPFLPQNADESLFRMTKNSGLKPSDGEIAVNPRSRSARLRYAVRTAAHSESGAKGGRHA